MLCCQSYRWELCVRLHWALQEVGVHKECKSQLVCQRQDGCSRPCANLAGQRQGQLHGRQGDARLYPAQAGYHHPQWREATQGRAHPAQQEDGTFVRASSHGHHGGRQARLGRRQETLHRGWENGRSSATHFVFCLKIQPQSRWSVQSVSQIWRKCCALEGDPSERRGLQLFWSKASRLLTYAGTVGCSFKCVSQRCSYLLVLMSWRE